MNAGFFSYIYMDYEVCYDMCSLLCFLCLLAHLKYVKVCECYHMLVVVMIIL